MQMELPEETRVDVVKPQELGTDAATAATAIRSLLLEACTLSNITAANLFMVTTAKDGDSISVTNVEKAGSGLIFEINFSTELAQLFKHQQMRFESAEAIEYELKTDKATTDEQKDSFESKYPVLLLLEGCGQASHFIHNRGYCALLGTLNGKSSAVNAQTVHFDTDMMTVQLECIDKNYDTIVFKTDCTINMIVRLTPV